MRSLVLGFLVFVANVAWAGEDPGAAGPALHLEVPFGGASTAGPVQLSVRLANAAASAPLEVASVTLGGSGAATLAGVPLGSTTPVLAAQDGPGRSRAGVYIAVGATVTLGVVAYLIRSLGNDVEAVFTDPFPSGDGGSDTADGDDGSICVTDLCTGG